MDQNRLWQVFCACLADAGLGLGMKLFNHKILSNFLTSSFISLPNSEVFFLDWRSVGIVGMGGPSLP